MAQLVLGTFSFKVADSISHEEIAAVIGNMQAQVDGDAVIAHDEHGNERTTLIFQPEFGFDVERYDDPSEPREGCPDCGNDTVVRDDPDDEWTSYCRHCGWRP